MKTHQDGNLNQQCHHRSRSGFSLIEVLIAILVLAIGMLGLGAVFPAIIAEQRNAFDAIEGENAASAAEAFLNNRELINFSLISEDFNRPIRTNGPVALGSEPRYSYEWVVPADGFSYNGWVSPIPGFEDFSTGLWSYNTNDSTVNPTINIATTDTDKVLSQIPVTARLFPLPFSGKEPKYVWDLALRRSPAGDVLQAAVFVRRIDARLRVPKGYSLSHLLSGGYEGTPVPGGSRLPVAINATNGQIAVDDGGPTMVYAAIQTLDVEVDPDHLDWLIFVDGRNPNIDTSVGFAARVGQQLVDNTGTVRTVVEIPSVSPDDPLSGRLGDRDRVVRVEPPFTLAQAGGDDTNVARSDSNRIADRNFDDERKSYVRQVIFTPRRPVAIRLINLEERP